MKSTCTSAALVLALVAGHVVVDVPLPQVRDQHSRAAALVDGSLHAYRLAKRADGPRIDARMWKGRAAMALPTTTTPKPPRAFAMVSTRALVTYDEPRRVAAADARAPPVG